ncbi:MAG: sugar transporter substrate-binding protein [Glaciihabitans sp.]|jgi:raffinose/stachyose/melibiose transport system substrate-binding protein|nr:sugar transporter substrate-binding protein [Glaciihabitans sp.]MDQ1571818.1 raffinose/stachyose/melibiose transport system substrate-binding protein [Actinomycetota bacterium]
MRKRHLAAVALLVAGALALAGCSGSGGSTAAGKVDTGHIDGKGKTLKVWWYDAADSATSIAWKAAIKEFEKETGAKVDFQLKSFEQLRTTASQVLNSNAAPDVLEYNKGNATAGLISSQGLLTNLDPAVKAYGWDKLLSPSIATTARYSAKGQMGSGHWYGVPTYGEYTMVYYNKDMFDKYGIAVPTTFDEFTAALQKFKDAGITPLAEAGAEYPIQQLLYQLALSKADRAWVNSFERYTTPMNFHDAEWTYAADTLKDWVDKGYISKNAVSLKAQDMANNFFAAKSPIMASGSWWYGTVESTVKFNWGTFLFPGSTLAMGSGGNNWSVPAVSKNKDLAYKFIDITMQKANQDIQANHGGLPVNADPSAITDEKSKELLTNFDTLSKRDGLSFYPDWPTATFYDQLVAATQTLVNGTATPNQMLSTLQTQYDAGVKAAQQ